MHVAVVGAGIAGLVATRTLKRAGVSVKLYEAGKRVGGRTHSLLNYFSPGLSTEVGGEFIDSRHADMFALAHEFNLDILDTAAPSERSFASSYFFRGRHRSESEIMHEYGPLAERMRADVSQLSPDISAFKHASFDAYLDQMSIAAYLDRIGAQGWLRGLLATAYLTEMGVEVDQQSCLNMLTVLPLDTSDGFNIFGESDERYKIRGGVEQIAQALGAELASELHLEHALVSLRDGAQGLSLEVEHDGQRRTESADFMILAIPFSVLRTIPMAVDLPAPKRLAIDTLGYGSSEKVIVGLREPVWRNAGRDGQAFSDLSFQSGWDSSRMQGAGATFSFYVGGQAGLELNPANAESTARRYVHEADALFPGLLRAFDGRSYATNWHSNVFSRGAYSFYRPGQWTTIAGWEREPCGRLFFAGEHCSRAFQGYMNGAAETGREAAQDIIRLVTGGAQC
ncbi:flavin monoamine oxidase family protein [Trinickia acidisoli]|uniref:flavin monoamine oxidase family protein n=1 Tax=Trinickia acidisoli TaxID=2767482 RepID=UPI001A8FAFBC|nr:NAD(P)/FAD-dependent oxidoreductase [Trinickia acidisoli]